MSTCVRCGRPLTDPESVAAGMGEVCAARAAVVSPSGELFDGQPALNGVGSLHESGLVTLRRADGRLLCNVPHDVRHHSRGGFDCGYGGDGPAELALNVMHAMLPPVGDAWSSLGGARVSNHAVRVYQAFKWAFIAPMDYDGGYVPIEVVNQWLITQLVGEANDPI